MRVIAFAILGFVLLACVMSSDAGAPPSTKRIVLKDKCDDVVFPASDVLVSIKYDGLNNITARLSAYSVPDGSPLWDAEFKVGKKYQLLTDRVFYEPGSDVFYMGNGPLSAVNCRTGGAVWTADFKNTGVVRWVRPGVAHLLVLGADRDSDVNNYEDLKKHFEKPRVICTDKATGQQKWSYAFEAAEDVGDVHVTHVDESPDADDLFPDYTRGKLVIKGKKVYCVSCTDGSEIWRSKDDAFGPTAVSNGKVYCNIDKKLACLALGDGSPAWSSEQKIDKTSSLSLVAGNILAIYPGEFKEGKNEGGYRFYAFDPANGSLKWKFDKSDNFIGLLDNRDGFLFIADGSQHWKISEATGEIVWKRKRRDDYGAGSWCFGQNLVDIGNKGAVCLDPAGEKVMWERKVDRAEQGGSLLLSALKGVAFLSNAAAGSGMGYDRRRDMMRQQQRAAEKKRAKELWDPDQERFESGLWRPPYGDSEHATVAAFGTVIYFPAKDKQVLAISADSGDVIWSLPTNKENPWTYFAPDMSTLAVSDDKGLMVVPLTH